MAQSQKVMLKRFGVIFALRGILYVIQAFLAYRALYRSLIENVFSIVFFALLALAFMIISYTLLSGIRRSSRLFFSIGLAMLILDPCFVWFSSFIVKHLVWVLGVTLLSALVFCWLRSKSGATPQHNGLIPR